MENITVPIKRVRDVPFPAYESPGAAAMDLRAAIDSPLTLEPGGRAAVPTGIAVAVPKGRVALVFARSGLATRHGVSLSNGVGVIDSDYRGEICVGLVNLGDKPFAVDPGDRIAQLAVFAVSSVSWAEGELDETERGSGGFGSTGL